MFANMAKGGSSKSWLPKGGKGGTYRSAASGRFLTSDVAHSNPSTKVAEGKSYAHSPSGRFALSDGTVIQTVRKDVMDRALGRGDFKKP